MTLPGSTMIRFEPRLWICSVTRAWAPEPTATMAITAATPMTIPSIVRPLRSLFTRNARREMRTLCRILTRRPPPASWSQPEPWRAAGAPGRTAARRRRAREPHDHVLSFREVAAEHLRGGAVGDTEYQRNRLRSTVGAERPHSPRDANLCVRRRDFRDSIVASALVGRQQFADLGGRRLLDPPGSRLPFLGRERLGSEGLTRLAASLQDEVELPLLLFAEAARLGQMVAGAARRCVPLATTTRGSEGRRRPCCLSPDPNRS